MKRLSATTAISIGLACLVVGVMMSAQLLGLLPDQTANTLRTRMTLAQTTAAQCLSAGERNDLQAMQAALDIAVQYSPEVRTAGVRRPDGILLLGAGGHASNWQPPADNKSNVNQIVLPLFQNDKAWGSVELQFNEIPLSGIRSWLANPLLRLIVFVCASSFLAILFFLRRVLRHLDPSSVIPDRVRTMLNALAEGIIIVDADGRVVMVNDAFLTVSAKPAPAIQGHSISELEWLAPDTQTKITAYPWTEAFRDGTTQRGVTMCLEHPTNGLRTFMVNAAPICGPDGKRRGALATFDDVTEIEQKNAQLRSTLTLLEESRDEVGRQNKELQKLATRDPLTGCLNRRAFLTAFDTLFNAAGRTRHQLVCIMVDLDHFKSINDQYGHIVGDQVLRQLGEVMALNRRDSDIVCRYGGEEFVLLIPSTSFEDGHAVAERLRVAIETATWPISRVTASIGVSGLEAGAQLPRELLDQADKALYLAKETGRNRVACWGQTKEELAQIDQELLEASVEHPEA